jgi:hypothetical protein
MFYIDALSTLEGIHFFDPNVGNYDVVLIMTYDHHLVEKIKGVNSKIKVGLIDPRNHKVLDSACKSDFLVIDSIEMEDYWRCAKKPIFRYAEYPRISYMTKTHVKKEKISICYHGNQIHLECMSESVTPALESLSKRHDIELVVMYNGSPPTGKELWYPKGVSVCHIQWSMNNYFLLSGCDVGIAPNNMLHDKSAAELRMNLNYSPDDYSLRFKMPSNPGRFIVYGLLGLPTVADFYPSALQYLKDDIGFVACNKDGWEYCLEKLIQSHELRQKMSDGLQNLVRTEFDFEIQNKRFTKFLEAL